MIEAAIVAYEQARAQKLPDMVERVARIVAGSNPDESDGGSPPKAKWEYALPTAEEIIALIYSGPIHMLKNRPKMNTSGKYVQGVSISETGKAK
jgi:hypothetical protein